MHTLGKQTNQLLIKGPIALAKKTKKSTQVAANNTKTVSLLAGKALHDQLVYLHSG